MSDAPFNDITINGEIGVAGDPPDEPVRFIYRADLSALPPRLWRSILSDLFRASVGPRLGLVFSENAAQPELIIVNHQPGGDSLADEIRAKVGVANREYRARNPAPAT